MSKEDFDSTEIRTTLAADHAPGGRGKVLVVDDVAANRLLLSEVLADEYAVEFAADGIQALAKVADFRPDVVLFDLEMPRMGGLEVCRRLRADPATRLLPIIVVTSVTERERRLECIATGANDFVNKPIDVTEVLTRTRSLLRQKRLTDGLESVESVMVALARTVEAKDRYTLGHSARVGEYAAGLGGRAGRNQNDQDRLRRAGWLHDIGKIAVREAVLQKPGALTAEEFDHIKIHPVEGEHILRGLRFAEPYLPAVRHHHERFDGGGYPDGLRGASIPADARIMAIADTFDAMTSDRPYRPGMPAERALAVIAENRGPQWDPELVKVFTAWRPQRMP